MRISDWSSDVCSSDLIRQVYDPEIPVNIFDLGLIYTLDIHSDGSVAIEMTLTAPACPVAGEMPQQVAEAVAGSAGAGEVQVTLNSDPPWPPERMEIGIASCGEREWQKVLISVVARS